MSWLAIVKKVGDHWEIDQDSAYLFEDEGGNYAIQEIVIEQIRSLASEPSRDVETRRESR
jgi:hypothetical protein